jgi:hypothetical protein
MFSRIIYGVDLCCGFMLSLSCGLLWLRLWKFRGILRMCFDELSKNRLGLGLKLFWFKVIFWGVWVQKEQNFARICKIVSDMSMHNIFALQISSQFRWFLFGVWYEKFETLDLLIQRIVWSGKWHWLDFFYNVGFCRHWAVGAKGQLSKIRMIMSFLLFYIISFVILELIKFWNHLFDSII